MNDLRTTAKNIRQDIIKMLARSAHGTATSLGLVDILVALYFGGMQHNPRNPSSNERDRLVLSNTHCAPALYATLAHAGYFSKKHLYTFTKQGSILQGRPTLQTPGVDASCDTPGNGLGIACGMALAGETHTFCILGDGEHQNGTVWEAALFAANHKLPLIAIIDRNNIQGDGNTEHIAPLGDLAAKYRAFGWTVLETDGHHIADLQKAITAGKQTPGPVAIIAHTTSGKGVRFIEHDHRWHKPVTPAQAKIALAELTYEKH
ncbi:transketolase [Candidatus Woesearchaeota archaeon]|nr:MAG: transketolase [Candidatus Woesearchaeota archaeon]